MSRPSFPARAIPDVRRLILLIVAIAAAAAPMTLAPKFAEARQETRKGVFNPKTFTLKNGMQVVVIEHRRAPVVTHMVWYKVGAADESPGRSGIAHFLEHLMFKGTKSFGPGEFSRIVATNGGRENAFTSQDYTAYFQNVAKDRLETVMRIEADRMTNLVLTDQLVKPERDVVLEERRSRTDSSPRGILFEQARAALFQNHPYGIPVIGWRHEITKLNTRDAIDFYRKYYTPSNAVLIVAGDVSVDKVRSLAEKYYGVIPARPLPPRVRPREPEHRAPVRVAYRDKRVRQPAWSRSFLAPSHNRGETKHAHALTVLSAILGTGATSRLYRSLVVEQKIATNAGAGYSASSFDLGSFYFYARPRPGTYPGSDPKAGAANVERAVEAELRKLLEKGVTEEEVKRAKRSLLASAIYARDNLSTGARVIGVALTTGRTVEDVEAWPERIKAVTVDQVNAAARAVFKERNSVTAVLLPAKPARPKTQ